MTAPEALRTQRYVHRTGGAHADAGQRAVLEQEARQRIAAQTPEKKSGGCAIPSFAMMRHSKR